MNSIIKSMKDEYYKNLLEICKIKNITNHLIKFDIVESENNKVIDNVIYSVSETEEHYNKEWNKLNIVHKKLKLKEYILNLNTDETNKKILIKKFNQLLKDKKITKKNDVNYDSENGMIISIPILKCKNNMYYV
jgi:hypothetical protein